MARQHNPQFPQREVTPDDLPVGQLPAIDLSATGGSREPEQIITDSSGMDDRYFRNEKFAAEMVTVKLERNAEKFQSPMHSFSVNGKARWLKVGVPTQIPRAYLEVILRSQPFTCETDVGEANVANPHNLLRKFQSARYPVSIIADPNPRGHEWAQRVAAGDI